MHKKLIIFLFTASSIFSSHIEQRKINEEKQLKESYELYLKQKEKSPQKFDLINEHLLSDISSIVVQYNALTYEQWCETMKALDNALYQAIRTKSSSDLIEAKTLFESNMDLINCSDETGDTFLIKASSCDYEEMVELIIKLGADVNASNNYPNASLFNPFQTTALISACRNINENKKNTEKIVKLLINAKADVNAKNNNDYNALIHAATKGHAGIVKLLLKAGARDNLKKNEINAFEWAKFWKRKEVLKIFEQYK